MTLITSRNNKKKRTLVISGDVLGHKMAGPGIRYYHLSRILGQYTDLTLAVLQQNDQALPILQDRLPDVDVIGYEEKQWDALKDVAEQAETIVISPHLTRDFPQLATLPAALVVDGYDPLLVASLATPSEKDFEKEVAEWRLWMIDRFLQYLSGDFFICASERQRYWWLGQLEVAGRINPHTFQADPTLRSLVDVVPYGLPVEPAQHSRQVVKGVWPGIASDDIVLLWGGGLWPWLDPVTAVRAVARLHADHPRLKLIFPGTVHPNQKVSQKMPVRNTEVYTLAKQEGLLNKAVFFGEWVPYADWPNVLLESDIALSLHRDSVETQLAFRSRILEYVWATVPVIATRGDTTSELVARYGMGEVVDYESAADVAQAIVHIINEGPAKYRQGAAAAQEELTWDRAAEPLIRFCQNPRRASDRQQGKAGGVPYYERRMRRRLMELLRRDYGLRRRLFRTDSNE